MEKFPEFALRQLSLSFCNNATGNYWLKKSQLYRSKVEYLPIAETGSPVGS